MPIAPHLDALSRYEPQAIRLVPTDGEPEDLLGSGGGLAAAFEAHGRGPLVAVLRDPDVAEVLLADGELQIALRREGPGARFVLSLGGTTVVDEAVDVPPALPASGGALFRPDPTSRVDDPAAAPEVAVHAVHEVGGELAWYAEGLHGKGTGALPLLATLSARGPETLGSAAFRATHGVRWAYVAGAMAGGIASADLVIAMAKAGLLGFFGAGGLPLEAVEEALGRISLTLQDGGAWGANLLHNPNEPSVEERTVDLYLKYGVKRVSASAYMRLSPAVVRYRLTGIHRDATGRVVCPHHVFAKVSRPEVAQHFLRPAPAEIVSDLLNRGAITAEQAAMAAEVPVAEDLTAEADSGGHTDHRPLLVLLPILQDLRDAIAAEQGYAARGIHPRVGAAGGLGTPKALWAAFAMGADYVLTGSVNQATVEAGTSDLAKAMLAEAAYTDVATGPAPDMFELGAKVQVLSRGAMYAQRSQKLYDLYKAHARYQDIPEKERAKLEKTVFKRPLDEVWEGTLAYWQQRDPKVAEKALRDQKFRMALTFRWYLGMTSRWARLGETDRKRDFQMWCGPAMGGFNSWAKGSDLEAVERRTVVGVAEALMRGAAIEARRSDVRGLGG